MLTPDLAVIVSALRNSPVVELSADFLLMRPHDNFQNWVLPEEQRDPTAHAAMVPVIPLAGYAPGAMQVAVSGAGAVVASAPTTPHAGGRPLPLFT